MPILNSTYNPPAWLENGHIQTVLPNFFRKVEGVEYRRERISTPDGDFLDLDWSAPGSDSLVIISHGLEGDSNRHYVKGMVQYMNKNGWDACAWNMRGCSGEPNRKPILYHSGATYDLDTVIRHILKSYSYEEIYFVGFSLGGNLTIKYFGEKGDDLDKKIIGGVAFSAPVDLTTSSQQLSRRVNTPYMMRFLRKLQEKIEIKEKLYPNTISAKGFSKIRDFKGFDDRYTAPLHGFENAEDYWEKGSSKPYINSITRPLLLVNAKDDPFLTPECYPVKEAEQNPCFYLEMPAHGGHTGFIIENLNGIYWSERRAVEFYHEIIKERAALETRQTA